MEVDEIQQQVCKFQRIASNGSATTDNSSNPNKIATTQKGSHQYFDGDGGGALAAGGGGGVAGRICGWPSSRIVRVSRASGGKDRHSKVLTSKGLRDRRVRLSVTTAIQFYDLQDRLGYDQPSKAVEWLIKAASTSIAELPSLDPSFPGAVDCNHNHRYHHRKQPTDDKIKETEFDDPNYQQTNNNNISVSKSSACSSTSETSKGSGLSLSRSENRMKARERAREMAAKKEKEKEGDPQTRVVNGVPQNSSFTDLLTGGISSAAVSPNDNSNPANSPPDSRIHWATPMDYFFNRPPQLPQFNITAAGENHPHHHHFSFLQENFSPAAGSGGGGGEGYNLNFSIASSSSGGGFATGFNRGTLQSNLVSVLPHQQHVQRFQSSSMVDGSTPMNFPLFMGQTVGSTVQPENFLATAYDSQRLQLYGGADGGRHKEKSKN